MIKYVLTCTIRAAFLLFDAQFTFNLAPKKPNWDLKRDIAPKLEKLEKKTQRAIIAMMRK